MLFERTTQALLLATTLSLPCVTHASVDLDKILSSQDYVLVNAANGVSLQTLRSQVVTDANVTTASPTGLNTSWLRITHLGITNNSMSNITIEVVFPTTYAGQYIWQALGPNGAGASAYPIDANGRATLTIPNINRSFTAEIRLPQVTALTKPGVNVVSVEGFNGITPVATPPKPKY